MPQEYGCRVHHDVLLNNDLSFRWMDMHVARCLELQATVDDLSAPMGCHQGPPGVSCHR
jgi:hypothetical protein